MKMKINFFWSGKTLSKLNLACIQSWKEHYPNNDINKTINSAKPPIFWKDKEIVKIQLNKWKSNKIENLINNLNDLELKIKKNQNNSLLIITDFILEKSTY